MAGDPLDDLYDRPGFMIRRAHQIAVSVFLAQTDDLGITTTQYGILVVLRHRPRIDQITVARLLGLDRSTTGMVIRTLEEGGLVARVVDPADKRRRSLELTQAGSDLLDRLAAPAERAVAQLLAPLDPAERPVFLALLRKLTGAFDATSRVPLAKGEGGPAPSSEAI
ncbi:MarR family winged helix-turn-helix transcriptional regulator [Methylobacterium nonmethylotrophicum]|uniref:MarR family transcriptional regulator n=1 Tax=Methylobacterium nonmethylotrophicum TaxID=1141884 RepID=A0A4Z0NHP8_9HYPH|nr:MarR family transcriptional regulator [Methylobacterium nonmethylotrophicum]TGD95802.1 MarR family transcriptional regulator [Methylobacterium nonmethylotrophicum]